MLTETELAERRALLGGFGELPELVDLRRRVDVVRLHRGLAAPDEQVLDQQTAETLEEAEQALVRLARVDCATFNAFVLRDEETNAPIVNEPMHEEWHSFLDQSKFSVIWASTESGKSTQISVGRTLWKLGLNRSRRFLIISNTDGLAQKIARQIGKYISESRELRLVFPDLKPDKNMPWTAHSLYVERDTLARDPSVQTCGMHGNILGSRLSDVVVDDILDHENTRTEAQRVEVERWIGSTLDNRLIANGTITFLSMVWDADDAVHKRAQLPAYKSMISPVMLDDGTLTQPTRWPLERIEAARGRMLVNDFARAILCKLRVASDKSPFKPEWMRRCRRPLLAAARAVKALGPAERVMSGVDLGTSPNSTSDRTAIATCLFKGDRFRQLLCIESGRWDGPEILNRLDDTHARYGGKIFVENVAAQRYILQFAKARSKHLPVLPFNTQGRGKVGDAALMNRNHPEWGFAALAIEFHNEQWELPGRPSPGQQEIDELVKELQLWEPGTHAPDRAMALWICVQGSMFGISLAKLRAIRFGFNNR